MSEVAMREDFRTLLTRNRTEEIGDDVWEQFVVPPFYDKLDLATARKARHVEGGRGCGKTMLLRYLSHRSAFSPSRTTIPEDAVRHVGIYWRADTQFARLFQGRGHSEAAWSAAFEHWIAVSVAREILRSLASIARSRYPQLTLSEVDAVSIRELEPFGSNLVGSYRDCLKALTSRLHELETWVANAELEQHPRFLPGTRFLTPLIDALRERVLPLRETAFCVYVDEYENLLTHQQRIVNTYLKHSTVPLIFHVAAKRNGMATTATTGDEQLVAVADYRTHDIEAYLAGNFDVFAGEVLMLLLSISGRPIPIDVNLLRDPDRLSERRSDSYRSSVLEFVRGAFPGLSHEELASMALASPSIVRRLTTRIDRHLQGSAPPIPAVAFIRKTVPRASVTAMAILARQRLSPAAVLDELERHEEGRTSKFEGDGHWIHNNFVGCLLSLYEGEAQTCPIYSGFDTFCRLARGNMRHLLELCHRALAHAGEADPPDLRVPPEIQADAARETSSTFLAQIKSFGRFGARLHTFTLRLGSLFALAHHRPTQSEPEISHFAIVTGSHSLSEAEEDLVREAVKWSVLFEEEATKIKEFDQAPAVEYVLNPIYAPYFGITYRKKRKLDIDVREFVAITGGSYDDFAKLLRRYIARWNVDSKEVNPSLFAHLTAGE